MTLAGVAVCVGAVLAAARVPFLVVPGRARRAVLAFPRHRAAGVVLTAVDLIWAGRLTMDMPLGRFDYLKPAVFVVGPVAFFLIIFFMEELLAARALGGILLLVASPVLRAAQWHASPWRLAVTVLAYVWVAAGLVLVLSPYRFRQAAETVLANDGRCRLWGAAGVVLGLVVLALGLTVY